MTVIYVINVITMINTIHRTATGPFPLCSVLSRSSESSLDLLMEGKVTQKFIA